MSIQSSAVTKIFQDTIDMWHKEKSDEIASTVGKFAASNFSALLTKKNWIDTSQWHKEDEIRVPDLAADLFIALKRDIDRLNQQRTDMVEQLDDWFIENFSAFPVREYARLNSETPAWMLDRLSIIELKIYHMKEQTERADATPAHIAATKKKLSVLLEQRADLYACYDQLLEERTAGTAFFKVYRQMKMYNDPNLNPSLYHLKHKS